MRKLLRRVLRLVHARVRPLGLANGLGIEPPQLLEFAPPQRWQLVETDPRLQAAVREESTQFSPSFSEQRLPLPARFGARVRELRQSRDWSQQELAKKARRHRTYIAGIERGERNTTLKVIGILAKALGVPEAELFTSESIVASAEI